MRAGDFFILGLIVASVLVIIFDGSASNDLNGQLVSVARLIGATPAIWLMILILPALLVLAASVIVIPTGRLPGALNAALTRQIRITDWISTTLADMVRWLALALVLVTCTVVIQRYVFGSSSTKLQESVIYFHSFLFLFSAGAALLSEAHVRVDILYSKMGDRGKAWTDLIGFYLALLPMCALILYTSQTYVGNAWRSLEGSRESNGLPLIFLLKTAIPVFAVLMAWQGAAMAGRSVLVLAGQTPPASRLQSPEREL